MSRLAKGELLELKIAYRKHRGAIADRTKVFHVKDRVSEAWLPSIKTIYGNPYSSGGIAPFFREVQNIAIENGMIDEASGTAWTDNDIRSFFSFEKCRELHSDEKRPEDVYWQIFRTLTYES